MEHFYRHVVKHRHIIIAIFLVLAAVSFWARSKVNVDYDMNDYLPASSASTIALDTMQSEFSTAIPNCRVMLRRVDEKTVLAYKKKIAAVDGVTAVTWLDDRLPNDTIPIEFLSSRITAPYYKNGNALLTVTISSKKRIAAVSAIRKIVGSRGALTGSAVSTALATTSTVKEIRVITLVAVAVTLLILTLTTTSWIEPFVVLFGLGVAIMLNAGSNLMFGTISFVTNAAGNILQLAVSLDYSVFLIHRFEECQQHGAKNAEAAMIEALTKSTGSILSSGLTTVIGFLALVLMRFRIGPDMGLALAKGVGISLITVFLFMPGVILLVHPLLEKTTHRSLLPDFTRFGRFVSKITVPAVVVFAILVVPAYVMSTQNSYYFGSSHIFSAGTTYGDDTAAIQKVFGKTDTYVLMVPKDDEAKERALAKAVKKLDHVTSVTDMTTMVGPAVPTEMLPEKLTGQLESKHYRRMVIAVRANYEGTQTFNLVKRIRKTADTYYPGKWLLAGEGVSTYDMMDTVTADMQKVNFVAIAAVFVVLLITMRSLLLPALLVLTIETAIWINFSIPHLTGTPIFYIAYLIISSIQLGATVDYAIYLTGRYKENRTSFGCDKKHAVVKTVSECLPSVLTSGTVLALVGLILGAVSSHGVLKEIGHFLGIGTILSLIMVLTVLPGLLYLADRFVVGKPKDPDSAQSV